MSVNKVLVCDDSATDLSNIKGIVEDAGYSTIAVTSGEEAVARAKSEKPDIIFLDIIMPGMDGYQACRELTNEPVTKDIPVIFVTSKHQKADRLWAQMQGAKDFISKPFTPEQIIEKLHSV